MKKQIKAIAKLANMDLQVAKASKRSHPLWEEEIHIEEELANLQESFATNIVAQESLRGFPELRKELIQEQRAILRHCVGLVARMTHKRRLPRSYTERDTEYALTRLTRMLVDEAHRVGKEIDEEVLVLIRPFLSIRQRLRMREWQAFDTRLYLQLSVRRLQTALQFA